MVFVRELRKKKLLRRKEIIIGAIFNGLLFGSLLTLIFGIVPAQIIKDGEIILGLGLLIGTWLVWCFILGFFSYALNDVDKQELFFVQCLVRKNEDSCFGYDVLLKNNVIHCCWDIFTDGPLGTEWQEGALQVYYDRKGYYFYTAIKFSDKHRTYLSEFNVRDNELEIVVV